MFRTLTLLAICLTLFSLGLGTYINLLSAGSICPDWPTCYGQLWLPNDLNSLLKLAPDFPTTEGSLKHAWLQMLHRYLSITLIGLALLLFILSWWVRTTTKLPVVSLTVILMLLAIWQAGLSMWAVNLASMPAIVLLHLLTALLILSVLQWLYLRAHTQLGMLDSALGPRKMAGLTFFILLLQILLGGWVTAHQAGAACSGFPDCSGSLWPQLDYLKGFNASAWLTEQANLDLPARQAIHWLHRVGAIVTGLMVLLLAYMAISPRCQKKIQLTGFFMTLLLIVQVSLGVLPLIDLADLGFTDLDITDWMLSLKLGHSLLSAILLMMVVFIWVHATRVSHLKRASQPPFKPVIKETGFEPVILEEIPAEQIPAVEIPGKEPENLLLRLKGQLHRTRGALADLTLGKKNIDGDLLEGLESKLIMADIGVEATTSIIDNLTQSLERNQLKDAESLTTAVRNNMLSILQPCNQPLQIESKQKPFVILVVGVNGVGKTTTIGKLAKRLQLQGHKVMLAAGDTFRAAAVEQLQVWGQRNQVPVVAQHTGADSASVIYDAVQSAQAKGFDVVIADTAGRLQTKSNLMEELSKVKRIMGKLDADAPHEVLLVLDACTGQNALSQVKQFKQAVDLTGIALTKLDGTAKGGVIVALAKQFAIPIRFIGVGEGIDDLQDFEAERFIDALFSE